MISIESINHLQESLVSPLGIETGKGGHWGRSVLSQLEEEAFFSLGPAPGPAVYLPPWAEPLPAYWRHHWPQVNVSLCMTYPAPYKRTFYLEILNNQNWMVQMGEQIIPENQLE